MNIFVIEMNPKDSDSISSHDEDEPPPTTHFLITTQHPNDSDIEMGTINRHSTDQASDTEDVDHKEDKNKLTFWYTVMHLVIGGASPTILNLPATFHQIGFVVGSVGSFVVVILYAYCMHTIVSCEAILCKRLNKTSMSYWEVLQYSFAKGPPRTRFMARYAKLITYFVFICIWGGGNATYVLLIGENIQTVLLYTTGDKVDNRTIILYLVIPLVLLCWVPNLKIMAFCSVLSNVLNAASIAIILGITLHNFPFFHNCTAIGDLSKLPYFLGVVLITVNGTGLLLSLKNEMKYPHQFSTKFGVINVAYVPTGVLYTVFGLLCYGKYGPNIRDNVITNLPQNAFCSLLLAMYAFTIILFYPLVSYVTYEIFWNEYVNYRQQTKQSFFAKYSVKTVNALFSIVLAYCIPNISLFISLIGNVCVALDSIILPAIMEMLVHWGRSSFCLRAKISMMIAIGSMLIVVGFQDVYSEFFEYY